MLISMEKLRGLLNDLWKDEPVECFLMCQACPDKCEQSEFALATFIIRQAAADKKYLPLAYAVTSTMYWCTVEKLAEPYSDEPLPAKDFELPEETATTDWWLLFRNAGHGCEPAYDAIAKWATRSELDPVDYFSDDWDDPQFLAAGLTTYLMKRLWNDRKEEKMNNIDELKERIRSITDLREKLKTETQELEKFCESIPEGKTIAELVKIVENVSYDGCMAIYLDGQDPDDTLTFNAEWVTDGPDCHYGGEMLQVSREDLPTGQVNLLSDILDSLGFFCSLDLYVQDEEVEENGK